MNESTLRSVLARSDLIPGAMEDAKRIVEEAKECCERCGSLDWRDIGRFEKHRPFRVEQEFQCATCGHRRQELVAGPFERRERAEGTGPVPSVKFCPKGGKRIYDSKRDAATAMNARMRSGRKQPEMLRAYPCSNCRGWHLSKQLKISANP